MTPPTSPSSSPDPGSASWYRSPPARRGRRKVVAVSLGVSLVLHVLLVLLYPLLTGPPRDGAPPPPVRGESPRPEGTEIIRIVEVPDEQLRRPDEPETERVPTPVPPRPRPPAADAAETEGPRAGQPEGAVEGATAAERVRATTPDVRLIVPLSDEVVALSPEQIAQLELVWALEDLNASAADAAERARRATDWTYTDAEGRRWGLSPKGLHLGGITIPMPAFGPAYDPEAWKGSVAADLERAAAGAAARDNREEQQKKIRERKDRERRERADTTRTERRRGGGGG